MDPLLGSVDKRLQNRERDGKSFEELKQDDKDKAEELARIHNEIADAECCGDADRKQAAEEALQKEAAYCQEHFNWSEEETAEKAKDSAIWVEAKKDEKEAHEKLNQARKASLDGAPGDKDAIATAKKAYKHAKRRKERIRCPVVEGREEFLQEIRDQRQVNSKQMVDPWCPTTWFTHIDAMTWG